MSKSPSTRSPRHPTEIDASVNRPGEPELDVVITDLSIDGCQVRGYFRQGENLSVTIPNLGKFKAEVRWAKLGTAGLRFERSR